MEMQGYLFSPPQAAQEIHRRFFSRRKRVASAA
jgi:hypothetical protein